MSSIASDDVYQDIQNSPLQAPATQDSLLSSPKESESAPKELTLEEPSSQFPNDVPMLRSCENCRRKKRKCSGDKPTCTRCTAQGETCMYRPTARYFKPRANGMGSGNIHRLNHSSKKRTSVGHVSSAGGSSMVTKPRLHYSAISSGGRFDGFDGGRRPRAMSTVTATLNNMHGSQMPIVSGSQAAMQQRMSAGVTTLAPADLMLSPAVAGGVAQADILPSPSTPSSMQPGSAPCLRQFSDAPQQYIQMQQQSKMGFGSSNINSVNGLAYMMPPVGGGGDEDATASSSTYYTSPSSNSTPPQLLLNMDFSFGQQSSAAPQPLLSSMAMSMNSDATVTSPLLNNKHQQQQQSMYPPTVGIASDIGTTNGVVSSPQPILADGDYMNLFTNTLKSQQSATMMIKTPMVSIAYTPTNGGSLMYSPPASAMSFGSGIDSCAASSYPLCSPAAAATTTTVAAAAAAIAAAAANGSGMWPVSCANTTGALVTPNPHSVSSSLGLQQMYQPTTAGPMDVGMEYAATSGSSAASSMMAAAAGGGLEFILPQNKNLFSEWLA
ncbi:hypothetical protein IW140_001714 [Coemansia sp. RSA 1813]|nr:hypothetical protein EV178_001510 [Coemansia sp. RSA 1646]KAJ1772509.1 hypothetical protein LPJ74_001410 [Coemansia sp. RSA 1843]KAJ2090912.1 hypothetical protein IW138_002316 [Coemansia sp. RSA 986]KAJ2214020.1 hypothetical protein EV179_003375 [Coemansia sp. RSA 487]KAJ2571260.1 hypothetical protein IW140_001714 [Coemansia sp. RSA 1813]